jgi:hypothetical protein
MSFCISKNLCHLAFHSQSMWYHDRDQDRRDLKRRLIYRVGIAWIRHLLRLIRVADRRHLLGLWFCWLGLLRTICFGRLSWSRCSGIFDFLRHRGIDSVLWFLDQWHTTLQHPLNRHCILNFHNHLSNQQVVGVRNWSECL